MFCIKKTLISLILIGFLTGCSSNDEPPKSNTSGTTSTTSVSENNTNESKSTQVEEKAFSIKRDDLMAGINNQIEALKLKSIKPIKKFKIDGNLFTGESSSESVAFMGNTNDAGYVTQITYVMDSGITKNQEALFNALVLPLATAKELNPNVDQKILSETVMELMGEAAEGIENPKNTHTQTIGNVEYTTRANKAIGLWFSFTPSK